MATVAFPSHWAGVAEIAGLLWLEGSYFQWMGLRKASVLCYKLMVIFTYKRHPDMVGVRELIFISLSSDTHYLWTQSHNELFLLKKIETQHTFGKIEFDNHIGVLVPEISVLSFLGWRLFFSVYLFVCLLFWGERRRMLSKVFERDMENMDIYSFPGATEKGLRESFPIKTFREFQKQVECGHQGPWANDVYVFLRQISKYLENLIHSPNATVQVNYFLKLLWIFCFPLSFFFLIWKLF